MFLRLLCFVSCASSVTLAGYKLRYPDITAEILLFSDNDLSTQKSSGTDIVIAFYY